MPSDTLTICGESFETNIEHFSFAFEYGKVYDLSELEKLIACPQLTSASFNSTNFDDSAIKILAKSAPGIRNLNLQDSQVTDQGIKYLSHFKQLQILRLKENWQLTHASIPGFNLLRDLLDLQIHETGINPRGLQDFLLPNLENLMISAEKEEDRAILLEISRKMPQCNILVKGKMELQAGNVIWSR